MSSNTLDSHHKNIVSNFKQNTENILDLEENIKILQDELDEINKTPDNECTDAQIKYKKQMKKNIKELKSKIKNVKNKTTETSYYIETIDIFTKYYNDNTFNNEEEPEKEDEETIFDFFNKTDNKTGNLTSFLTQEKGIDKKNLFNEYLEKINFKNNNDIKIDYVNNYTMCENCKEEKILINSESVYVCNNCGESSYITVDYDKSAYKEYRNDVVVFSYKRFSHFTSELEQPFYEAEIPKDVFDIVLYNVKKQHIINIKSITYNKIKKILKMNGLSKYYNLIPSILDKLNNKKVKKLSKELKEKMKIMFKRIQEPFAEVCPAERINFLNYSYVIRKFLELLKETDYVKHYPLLKSREKLHEQDLIWKRICNHKIIQWEYKPSI